MLARIVFLVFAISLIEAHNPCFGPGIDPNNSIIPHETNCRYFYKCSNGMAYLYECPSNLEFDPVAKRCDYPESAGCSSNGNGIPNPDQPCNLIPEPVCPEHEPSKPAVILPHSKDCRKFYICDWGVPYMQNCPFGLHFSQSLKVCDWPWRAKCACSLRN